MVGALGSSGCLIRDCHSGERSVPGQEATNPSRVKTIRRFSVTVWPGLTGSTITVKRYAIHASGLLIDSNDVVIHFR
jgi:hypothetical protein